MMHPRSLSVPFLAVALGAASPLAAQVVDAPTLPIGRTMDGTLSRTDPTINERGRFKVFKLDGRAGQRYSIVMRADDFDSYLSVGRNIGGLTDYLASDDDGAGNSNARLKFTPKETGTYYIVAQALGADGIGNFTVRMDTLPPKRIVAPVALSLGAPATGELSDTDAEVDEKGPFYDMYRFTARRGQRYVIEMSSTDFDSYLGVGRMDGDSLKVDETDDDGGGGNNARLRFTAKEDGEYLIRAQAQSTSGSGAYTIKISERAAPNATITPVTFNAPMSGELSDTDDEAEDGTPFDGYKLTVRAGETVTITMRSTDFDSYLVLGKMSDGTFDSMATDDDGAGGNNSKIEHTFEQAGEYIIRANSVGGDARGRYTLRVDRAAGRTAAPPRRRGTSGDAAAAAVMPPAATDVIAPPRASAVKAARPAND